MFAFWNVGVEILVENASRRGSDGKVMETTGICLFCSAVLRLHIWSKRDAEQPAEIHRE